MRPARRSQQQRRRVDRPARDDDERCANADGLAIAFYVDGLDVLPCGIGDEAERPRVGPQLDVAGSERGLDAADLRVALGVDSARKGVAGAAQHAAVRLARSNQAERQVRGLKALSPKPVDDRRHAGSVRNRRVGKRAAWRFGRIATVLSMHMVEPLGAVVVRLERVVVDRPGRRDTVHVLDCLKVLTPQAIEHAAPELRIAADAVMRVRKKLLALTVQPALGRAVAQVLPHGLRIPVVRLLRHGLPALDDEDASRARRERQGHGAAAGAAADDDDVVASVHCPMARQCNPGGGYFFASSS